MKSRLVIAFNALVVLVLGILYWFIVRPLPQTTGTLEAPVAGEASVRRDARGVPHIAAASWQDAIFLQGFVTAQDRLWQMDILRRYAAGDLAEIFGAVALESDRASRTLRLREIANAYEKSLTPEDRAVLVEYARGVNFFIESTKNEHRDFSVEFNLPFHRYDPRPWTLADSLLIGLLMFRDLTDSSLEDSSRGQLLALGAEPARLHVLFPAADGADLSPGSNAWAVSGAHTADGKPILANDPHLKYRVPGMWHLVDLKAPAFHVSGAALPGVPCVITGHNENIAWGVTNLGADVADLYFEQINEQTGIYQFQGKPAQAALDHEIIGVRDAAQVTLDIWVTRHGPVFHQNGKAVALRWSAAEGFGFPFMKIDQAKNWDEFRAAVHDYWGPAQNFVYADRAGNIGYQAAGRVPIRRSFDGDVPLEGASGQFEWDGYIPFEQMPNLYNPPSGIIATANQNPFPRDYPYRVTGNFADKYRVNQIRSLLEAKPKLTVDDMLAVQKDVYSAYDHFVARQAVAAFEKAGAAQNNSLMIEAVGRLRDWDGQMDKDQTAPAIAELLSNEMRSSLLKLLVPQAKDLPDILPRPQVVEKMLRAKPSGWVPKDDWNAWLLENFAKALDTGRDKMGSVMKNWRWGSLLQWRFEHPVLQKLPGLETVLNMRYAFNDLMDKTGPFEMSGSSTTVKQTSPTLGPSERMVVDLGDLDKSVQNLMLGESGFVASGHYKDQWPAYYVGKSFPMEFDHVDAKEEMHIKPK